MTASLRRIGLRHEKGAAPMTSAPVRDQRADHLITPENAALLLIDYQPSQLAGVCSMHCAKDTRSTPSSTRSAAPRQRPTAPAWTA
jgi:hypothetical protein